MAVKEPSITKAKRYSSSSSSFGGVDYSTQKFSVANGRAIDALDFVRLSDGVVQVREGTTLYSGLFVRSNLTAVQDLCGGQKINLSKTPRIHSIWKFNGVYIVHAGRLLWKFRLNGGSFPSATPLIKTNYSAYGCVDEDSQRAGFYGDGKFWFFGGEKLLCVDDEFNVFPAEDEAYVPLTHSGITSAGAGGTYVESVNALTKWRRNGISSSTSENKHWFLLDGVAGGVSSSDYENATLTIKTVDSKGRELVSTYKGRYHVGAIKVYVEDGPIHTMVLVPTALGIGFPTIVFCHEDIPSSAFSLGNENGLWYDKSEDGTVNIYYCDDEENELPFVGYILMNASSTNSKLVLYKGYDGLVTGEANIEVKFPVDSQAASLINECRFGCQFGAKNARNRLFSSGNPSKPNMDFFTESVLEGESVVEKEGDYSYWPDVNYHVYGSDQTKVVGFSAVSSGNLLVLKEGSNTEATAYYAYSTSTTAGDDSENAVEFATYASITANQSGSGPISPSALTSMNGDTLFLSNRKRIEGLDTVGVVYDTQRIANSRSVRIDKFLDKCDLEGSVLWSDNDALILSMKSGTFITYYDTLYEGQYEWWRLSPKGFTAFCSDNGRTLVGTEDGRIGFIGNGSRDDIQCHFTSAYFEENGVAFLDKTIFTAEKGFSADIEPILTLGNNEYLLCSSDFSKPIGETELVSGEFGVAMSKDFIGYVKADIEPGEIAVPARVSFRKPIEAFFISAPQTMGDLSRRKTVWGWTISNDTGIPSSVDVCIVTNEWGLDGFSPIQTFLKNDYGFSFGDEIEYSFDSFSWDRFVIPHSFTTFRPICSNFFCVGIRNEAGKNAVMSNITLSWSVAGFSTGRP